MRPMGVRSSPFRVSLPDVKGHTCDPTIRDSKSFNFYGRKLVIRRQN